LALARAGDIEDWANDEFGAAKLGDARLTSRLVSLARQLSRCPQTSFPQSLDAAQLKGAYRFFDNAKVDPEGVLAPHVAQTLTRMEQVPLVLAIQDTTEFNLTHLRSTEGLGYIAHEYLRGFLMHSLLAVTPEGLPLGVLGMKTWVRPIEQLGKKRLRKSKAIGTKESVKWLEGIEHLATLKSYCSDTHIVGISDREGDVYDAFIAERPIGVDWLVRASWNRRVEHPEQYLWPTVLASPVLGQTELQIPARADKPPRTARLEVRCTPVTLRAPANRQCEKLPLAEVFAIHVLEVDINDNVDPLEWLLLCSMPTHTYEQALERLAWYARRWTIESWHRVLKSGCRIEARQFGTLERFVRATALFAVIAWRVLYTTLLARLDGDLPCEVVLQPVEWQALYCRVHRTANFPNTVPSLEQAVLWIAGLGGYLNRKHDPPPGPTVMWRGFLALHEITEMYRIFRRSE
jgi:hypothetical protein